MDEEDELMSQLIKNRSIIGERPVALALLFLLWPNQAVRDVQADWSKEDVSWADEPNDLYNLLHNANPDLDVTELYIEALPLIKELVSTKPGELCPVPPSVPNPIP